MGSGFRTFTAGEILTASNVQNYLQDQVVMTFAGSAARSSAIGTANFEEGMTSYLTDTDKMEVYNGTNWVSVAPTTSQGLTLINTTSFSGVASVSLPTDTFTSTYNNYQIIFNIPTLATAATLSTFRLRAAGVDNSSNNYRWRGNEQGSNTLTYSGFNDGGITSSFRIAYMENTQTHVNNLYLFNPKATTTTSFYSQTVRFDGTNHFMEFDSGATTVTTSYDSATFLWTNNQTGSLSVYGFNR